MTPRVAILTKLSHLPPQSLRRSRLLDMWNKIDREVGRIFIHGESVLKTPKQRKAWSPDLVVAGATKRYWKIRLSHAHQGKSYCAKLLRKSRELHIVDDLTEDIAILQQRQDDATHRYEEAAGRDENLRAAHLETLGNSLAASVQTSTTAKAIRSLKKSEVKKKMFSRIKTTLKPLHSGSVSRVDVPQDLIPHINLRNPNDTLISNDSDDLKNDT